ncbi:hypothetical protein BDF19DRAFT_430075 [Syncephalis fuscata]|nr:hypothetical protein BDF19DRAFT_430075 [Syncephalis fuscata]
MFISATFICLNSITHTSCASMDVSRNNIDKRVVSAEEEGLRLHQFLRRNYPEHFSSRRRCIVAIRAGEIHVNGAIAEETRIVHFEDNVEVYEDVHLSAIRELERLCVTVHHTTTPETVCDASNKATQANSWSFSVVWKPAGVASQEIELIDTKIRTWKGDNVAFNTQAIYWIEKSASGWLILARNLATFNALQQQLVGGEMQCQFRALCKGKIAPGIPGATIEIPLSSLDSIEPNDNDDIKKNDDMADCTNILAVNSSTTTYDSDAILIHVAIPVHGRIVNISASNSAGHLTTIDTWLDIQRGSCDSNQQMSECTTAKAVQINVLTKIGAIGRFIRRALASIGHPIIGNVRGSEALPSGRGKGYMLSLIDLKFQHPSQDSTLDKELHFQHEEPSKMTAVRAREERFRAQRRVLEAEDLALAGMELNEFDTSEKHTPIAYVTGEKKFCSLRFQVTKDTLIPRISTETLVSAALRWIPQWQQPDSLPKIMDIGTGCGCLLISVLNAVPTLTGVGIDLSTSALAVANANAKRLLNSSSSEVRYKFLQADMLQLDQPHELAKFEPKEAPKSDDAIDAVSCTAPFTHVICNPPYLTEKRYQQLSQLTAEPAMAVVGTDEDGLGAYRALASVLQSDQLLQPGGLLILEVGHGLAYRVENSIFASYGIWHLKDHLQDQHATVRCLVFEKRGI